MKTLARFGLLTAFAIMVAGACADGHPTDPPDSDVVRAAGGSQGGDWSFDAWAYTLGPNEEFYDECSFDPGPDSTYYEFVGQGGAKDTVAVSNAAAVLAQCDGDEYDAGRVVVRTVVWADTQIVGTIPADHSSRHEQWLVPDGATIIFQAQLEDEESDCPGEFLHYEIGNTEYYANPFTMTESEAPGAGDQVEAWFQCDEEEGGGGIG